MHERARIKTLNDGDEHLEVALFKSVTQRLALITLVGSDESEKIVAKRNRYSSDSRDKSLNQFVIHYLKWSKS